MDGFVYMSIQSRIQHQEDMARRSAAQLKRVKPEPPAPKKLAVATPARAPLELPETRSA